MIVATGVLLLPAMLVASTVDVRSATDCPSSADVGDHLRPLLPPAQEAHADEASADEASHVALIESVAGADGAELRLRLLRADGYVIGDRRMTTESSCADTAEAVAAVIAAWETTSPPSLSSNAGDVVPVAASAAAPAIETPRNPFQLIAGAAAGAALVGGIAGSGSVELALGRAYSRWQLRVGAATETVRRLDLYPGQVDWQHTSFALTLMVRSRNPVWLLSVDAGPTAGWSGMHGDNFSRNLGGRSFEWGVDGGLRGGRWFGRIAAWAEARTSVWVQGQRARLNGSDGTSADLPLIDVTLRVGISVRML